MNEGKYIGTKYPKEANSVVRDQTLAVTPELTRAEAANGESPGNIYSGFARFVWALINKAKIPATANFPEGEYAGVVDKTRAAQASDTFVRYVLPSIVGVVASKQSTPAQVSADYSAAFSVRFLMGKLKGKTPAEVLREDPVNGKKILESQRDWLTTNLDQYPVNSKQIDAINAAFNAQAAGALDADAASGGQSTGAGVSGARIPLYESKYRANIYKKREDGKCPVSDMYVTWIIGHDYPVEIRIVNYWAPAFKDASTGKLNVQAAQTSDKVDNTMLLQASEWSKFLSAMQDRLDIFKMMNAKAIENDMVDSNNRNRNAAKANQKQ